MKGYNGFKVIHCLFNNSDTSSSTLLKRNKEKTQLELILTHSPS